MTETDPQYATAMEFDLSAKLRSAHVGRADDFLQQTDSIQLTNKSLKVEKTSVIFLT